MISDEELYGLPSDPELAFVQFEKILRNKLQEEERYEQNDNSYDADTFRIEYMNKVAAAAKAFGIISLSEIEVPKCERQNYSLFLDKYRQFVADVDHVTIQIRIHTARADREGTVGLDDIERKKIHHFIEQIRIVIHQADLPEDKRDDLLEKLNKFAAEVDRRRTRLQAAMAVIISVCDGIGQGFQKLEPARRWLDSIAAVLGHVKANEERADERLPPPSERKKIEPPKRRLPPPAPRELRDQLDEDIPF
jgi:hypothetical protein